MGSKFITVINHFIAEKLKSLSTLLQQTYY